MQTNPVDGWFSLLEPLRDAILPPIPGQTGDDTRDSGRTLGGGKARHEQDLRAESEYGPCEALLRTVRASQPDEIHQRFQGVRLRIIDGRLLRHFGFRGGGINHPQGQRARVRRRLHASDRQLRQECGADTPLLRGDYSYQEPAVYSYQRTLF